ncbi:DUF5696 domain-containing protein [Lacrimispora sp.]|uniref:DUF5696 domain-containing protein n=1 Tax=Lacrimispora sp. TaxID=2719234 RepID=UPI0028B0F3AB|nr:DUF5696 domain-containing protein [Lacrimispora sp.]
MHDIIFKQTALSFEESSLLFSIKHGNVLWKWDKEYRPRLVIGGQTVYFQGAASITHRQWKTGIGEGIISHYQGFQLDGMDLELAFETVTWIEYATEDVHFEWIPLTESSLPVSEIYWPGYMEFEKESDRWYTLLNIQQGLLIPNTWETALEKLPFDGMMCTAGSYMPWFGQVKEGGGYLAICEQPWDAAYYAEHPAKGPYTHTGIKWLPSLGRMNGRRTMRYSFLPDCDYNDICKHYRTYVKEQGTFCSLKEKAAKAPVHKLVGASFIHKGIKTQVMPDSRFFDPENPDKNNHVYSFEKRTGEIHHFHKDLGLKKLYLHLDGWAEPGYDNQHPDYLPACKEAGDWEKMKELADTMHGYGYSFGIHDQYRDYYRRAKTFDQNFAAQKPDGTLTEHANWAGGPQTYLCATQAPYYVKRNFTEIKKNGVELDCAYLDVFTCNEPDECDHPWHRINRKECLDYRSLCFEYLLSKGILPSSEEVTDWSVKSLVFCHYAPYSFMMHEPGADRQGIPVPLFNLVYHDCLIIPWMMEKYEKEDFMLYALLNGGAPYFIRDGAYENIDGSFGGHQTLSEEEMAARCGIVASLHERVAMCEMLSHEFIDGDPFRQRTTFSDGTAVEADLLQGTYEIRTEKVTS